MGGQTKIPKPKPGQYLAKKGHLYGTFPDRPQDVQFYKSQGWQKVNYEQELALYSGTVPPAPVPKAVMPSMPIPEPIANAQPLGVDDMTAKQLKEIAPNFGIDPGKYKASELRELLRAEMEKSISE